MIGAFVQTPQRSIAQVLAHSGVELLIADGEHAPLTPAGIEEIIVGGDLAGVPVWARVPFSPAAVSICTATVISRSSARLRSSP